MTDLRVRLVGFDFISALDQATYAGGSKRVRSQLPLHHPSSVRAPAWYQTWMTSYNADEDMAHYFGIPPRTDNATTTALERLS